MTGEQLALPMDAPVVDLAAAAEAKRIELGISQREAARVLGIRQPHYCDALIRRHETSSSWLRNRVLGWVGGRLAA